MTTPEESARVALKYALGDIYEHEVEPFVDRLINLANLAHGSPIDVLPGLLHRLKRDGQRGSLVVAMAAAAEAEELWKGTTS